MNAIADAYIAACRLELDALKPGNVHRWAEGHGMTCADFEISAEASAPAIARRGAPVGERILAAVIATKAAVGQNTNLGIVLLCAPLAVAAERGVTLPQVLAELDVDDAQHTFKAIATANPGGLGSATRHDVHNPAATTLRQAMIESADRDLIARQYANGFADILYLGLDRWGAARLHGENDADSTAEVYLTFLRTFADTHIARKYGPEIAETLRRDAAARTIPATAPARLAYLLDWDTNLKARGLNPGACADLTVATVFAALLPGLRNVLQPFANSG